MNFYSTFKDHPWISKQKDHNAQLLNGVKQISVQHETTILLCWNPLVLEPTEHGICPPDADPSNFPGTNRAGPISSIQERTKDKLPQRTTTNQLSLHWGKFSGPQTLLL